jgi:lipopolysaccharide biosynthesis glycosyltransferase
MNAIVLLAIGSKYEKILEATRSQFKAYAKRCNATLEICTELPDPTNQGHLFTQKLLIPKKYEQYDWIAFLDLDIVISESAPSIFETVDPSKGFGAILDPRGQDKFNYTNIHWFGHRQPEKLTTRWYFEDRGFEWDERLIGSFNAGVWLCQPKLVADLFANYYWERTKVPSGYAMHEEAPMAYLTQTHDLFFSIDERFNQQLIYLIADQGAYINTRVAKLQRWINKQLGKVHSKRETPFMLQPYIQFVDKSLKENYILHFSGNFPIPENLSNQIKP